MNTVKSLLLALAISVVAIGAPIAVAIREAHEQSYRIESMRALSYARDVINRTDETTLQVMSAAHTLRQSGAPACSPASVDLMRRFDLTSSYIQALGVVQGDKLACSSMGTTRPIPLGPALAHTVNGATIREAPELPGGRLGKLIVLQFGDLAAIIHRDLPIDTTTNEPDVALAVIQQGSGTTISARGVVDPRWIDRLAGQHETVFVDRGYVVAVARSNRFQSAAIAAIPVTYLNNRSAELAWRLIPAGLLAGILATAAILYLARRQMSLVGALRTALKSNELFMVYQPVIDMKTGAWIGAEALVRWRRPTGELIRPDFFIPIAEKNGLINKLSQKVLELILHDTTRFLHSHPNFHIAINLSASDFNSPHLAEKILASLEASGLRPVNLIVEITERGLLDVHRAREITQRLQGRGIEIAIDDFGTGYSSLSYLESLRLDFLKIDRSFIESIGSGAPISLVVPHIIEIAHTLSMKIIAEGVENEAQHAYLVSRGVQFAQGMLFAKPMSCDEMVAAIRTREAYSPAHSQHG
ncbi:MAG: EAL domain-containing protein [Pseudomonadota bacterium]